MPSQDYISAQEVADLVLADPRRDDFLILDVRSSDFYGGNLPGAVNLTTDKFSSPSKVESVIKRYISTRPGLRLVIVHCMRSQTRGPYVAHLVSHSPALPSTVEVKVLKGGFQGWYREFKGRRELFENLEGQDEQEWEDVVKANEGEQGEARDSRELRERLAR
ncbi:hypothetical protein JCM10212_000515 [Sporobolomyces blumeae]